MTEANPLLAAGVLPAFDRIRPEHVVPAVQGVLAEAEAALARLEAGVTPSASALLEPYERITDRVGVVWSAVSHLMAVRNSEALREAYEAVQPEVVRFQLRLAQSRPVHGALEALAASPEFPGLAPVRQRIVSLLLRDARLAGVGLEGAARERFNAIETELADLATRFGNHLLDATKAFSLVLRDPGEVAGLPESLLGLAAQSARDAGHPEATAEHGPWRITLDRACSGPFLEHSRRRELRERVYRASVTRASGGALDNGPILARILDLRREQAALLGFASYAEMSLASKMAPDVAVVERLLEEVRRRAYPAARTDLAELRAFAQEIGAPEAEDLRSWDVPFFAERLREARFAYSEEELRPYFPLPRVLEGLFDLARRLFGVRVEPADGEVPIWHPDVRFFRVRDESGADLAAFTLDPYSRPSEKRGGAWMDDCVGRSLLLAPPGATVRLPVAHLVCNQIPPVGERPSLMSFEEVSTLFHEFGHGLQHMLTTVDEGLAAGIRNVEWDAVELPSQFMENWCYHGPTLLGLSRHVETGAPLPDPTFEKIRAARTFRAGSFVLRQLHFGLTDLELHHRFVADGAETAFDVMRRIGETTTVLPPIPEDRFLCSFSHIFAGGYAAGYYGYLWADVLAADAFAAFEEAGLDDPRALAAAGRRFRETVLGLGGSRHPLEVFRSFRGREPTPTALLHQLGLEQERDVKV